MPRKPIELPPEVAKAFVADMRAYFAAGNNTTKADEIAARPLHALRAFQRPREKKLKLGDEGTVLADEGSSVKTRVPP